MDSEQRSMNLEATSVAGSENTPGILNRYGFATQANFQPKIELRGYGSNQRVQTALICHK
jgi:hypothetical protein